MGGQVERRKKVTRITNPSELWDAINHTLLKPMERNVVIMKCFEDFTHNQIAYRLNISEKTSQRLFASAIKKMQDAL